MLTGADSRVTAISGISARVAITRLVTHPIIRPIARIVGCGPGAARGTLTGRVGRVVRALQAGGGPRRTDASRRACLARVHWYRKCHPAITAAAARCACFPVCAALVFIPYGANFIHRPPVRPRFALRAATACGCLAESSQCTILASCGARRAEGIGRALPARCHGHRECHETIAVVRICTCFPV